VSTQPELLAAEPTVAYHVERFWRLLETETVRIQVDMRRDTSSVPYWDSSSFSDAVAKALVAERCAPAQCTLDPLSRAAAIARELRRFHGNACHPDAMDSEINETMQRIAALSAAQCAPQPSGEPAAWQYRLCLQGRFGAWLDVDSPIDVFRTQQGFRLENGMCELRPLYAALPAAGGEASKREAEIVERCAKIADTSFIEGDEETEHSLACKDIAAAIRASLRKDG
jgi:hypothetical protein